MKSLIKFRLKFFFLQIIILTRNSSSVKVGFSGSLEAFNIYSNRSAELFFIFMSNSPVFIDLRLFSTIPSYKLLSFATILRALVRGRYSRNGTRKYNGLLI